MSLQRIINIYICPLGHNTITVDLDEGTTPFMIGCRYKNCKELSRSQFYRVNQDAQPEYEWYKRDDIENMTPNEFSHNEMGGLFLRKIESKTNKELKMTMKIHIQAIKNYTADLAKQNEKKFSLKESNESTAKYFDAEIMFESAKALFIDLNDSLNGIIDVPDNWRELVENKFSLKKIKSTLNSKIEKQRLNGKEKN